MIQMLQRGRRPRSYGERRGRRHPAIVLLATFALMGWSSDTIAKTLQIVALGDSLMAGYNLPAGSEYPARLEAALRKNGLDVAITNASVSGDTTAGGLDRIDWSVPDGTDGVLLELGANDMLRGQDPALAKQNLAAMIDRLKSRRIAVYLLGMKANPTLGADYVARFDAIYPDLAKADALPLYPFLLDGVAANATLQLADGMHPNPAGVAVMVDRSLTGIAAWIRGMASR